LLVARGGEGGREGGLGFVSVKLSKGDPNSQDDEGGPLGPAEGALEEEDREEGRGEDL
jgi:hypothetical protein